jgi:hypothetical protein
MKLLCKVSIYNTRKLHTYPRWCKYWGCNYFGDGDDDEHTLDWNQLINNVNMLCCSYSKDGSIVLTLNYTKGMLNPS